MFKYVFIPADDSEPMELREGPKSSSSPGGGLAREAEDHFSVSSEKIKVTAVTVPTFMNGSLAVSVRSLDDDGVDLAHNR